MNQKHITILERESIFKLLTLGYSWAEIARRLGRNRSTIGREVKRNTIDGEYSPFKAQSIYNNSVFCNFKCQRCCNLKSHH